MANFSNRFMQYSSDNIDDIKSLSEIEKIIKNQNILIKRIYTDIAITNFIREEIFRYYDEDYKKFKINKKLQDKILNDEKYFLYVIKNVCKVNETNLDKLRVYNFDATESYELFKKLSKYNNNLEKKLKELEKKENKKSKIKILKDSDLYNTESKIKDFDSSLKESKIFISLYESILDYKLVAKTKINGIEFSIFKAKGGNGKRFEALIGTIGVTLYDNDIKNFSNAISNENDYSFNTPEGEKLIYKNDSLLISNGSKSKKVTLSDSYKLEEFFSKNDL